MFERHFSCQCCHLSVTPNTDSHYADGMSVSGDFSLFVSVVSAIKNKFFNLKYAFLFSQREKTPTTLTDGRSSAWL